MPTFLEENPRKFAQEIAAKNDCTMKTVRDLNQCLMDMSALELLEAFMEHGVRLMGNFLMFICFYLFYKLNLD